MSPKVRVVFVGFMLLAIVASVLLLRNPLAIPHPQAAAETHLTDDEPGEIPPPALSPPDRQTSQAPAAAATAETAETWEFNLGGEPFPITLALDEAVLRDADGREMLTRLEPPATLATLPARLAELSAPGGVFPVAYLAGEERSTATRRLVTPDLRVQLDDASAARVATSNRLVIKERPAYAPGWVIMSAKDAFAALDAMMELRKVRDVASVDVLLAVQHSKRAMPNDTLIGKQWHLKRSGTAAAGTDVNIEAIWNYPNAGSRGAGVRIGIVDDGLQTGHPDLAANVDTLNDKDWNGNDADPNPGSGDDHGTACAGNAAARGNNNLGVSGSAPEATLVGMRLIAASVTDAQEAEAMAYLPNLIEIKSNSWGPSDTGKILAAPGPLTLAALASSTTSGRNGKGNIFLWAGGNGGAVGDNSNYDGYANSIHTIAIGATDSTGARAYYSERGSNLVVCAPSSGGLDITTTDRTGTVGYNTSSSANGGDYANDFGGTSSSTPTAAGIVALMLEKNPNLGWRDVQEILIRSATKFRPTDADWINNGAGIPFNHNFGAGLINATAAVNMAATWANLATATSTTSTQSSLTAAIPDNNATGITRTFDLSASKLRVEHVTVRLSINHTSRGNLEITLTSPTGMASKLSELHSDSNDNYSNWTFSSVRHWGENSGGTWSLKISDRSTSGNSTGGTLTAVELKVFGAPAAVVNPSPVVQITQPINGQSFSPNTPVTVNVAATDLTLDGAPGTVSEVSLTHNGALLGIATTAPYSFLFTPGLGSHTLVATATDSEGAVGTSGAVLFSVANQAPVITAASLSASGNHYSDVPLSVSSITATDPEGSALTYSYQWQSSGNGSSYSDEPGATQVSAPSLTGKLIRCVVTASDGDATSNPFTTAAVNLLDRPVSSAQAGSSYAYTSGLVLRGTYSQLSRRAILNEFSQGPSGGTAEWIEILTLQSGSLAAWKIKDASGTSVVFLNTPVWQNIPAGTLIVIYNSASKDPLLPADDTDPADGKMVLSSANASFFTSSSSWPPLGNSGDSIFLVDAADATVHSLAYGNSTATTPNVGSVAGGSSAHYDGDTDAGANLANNWRVTTSVIARAFPKSVTLPLAYGGPWDSLPAGFTGIGLGSPYLTSLGGDTQVGSARFDTTGDSLTIAFGSQAGSLSYQLKGNPGSGTQTQGTFLVQQSNDGINYSILRTHENLANTDTPFTDQLSVDARYLRFLYQLKTLGNIQLDKLVISTGTSTPSLTLSANPGIFAENLGSAASVGTVSIPAALDAPLVVALSSSDPSEATVPATVTLPAGETSVTFPITAVDDADPDGPQSVTLTASADNYTSGTVILTVTDDESQVEGVTPASPNNELNQGFIVALRNGSLNSPALFRLGEGTTLPLGLSLDATTGILSGELSSANAAGDYLIIIERYNSLGEAVSQSFTLTLDAAPVTNTFSNWIGSYQVGQFIGFNDDFDGDGVPNGIEYFLGTPPDVASAGLTEVSASPSTMVFHHSRTKAPASDVSASYEWSVNLVDWNPSGSTHDGTTVTFSSVTVGDNDSAANDVVRVTATQTGTPAARFFARLKADVP